MKLYMKLLRKWRIFFCSISNNENGYCTQMVGSKRSRPFSMEMIPPVPPFRFQAPTISAQMSRLDSSLSCGSHSMINLEPCDTISRYIYSFHPSILNYGYFIFVCLNYIILSCFSQRNKARKLLGAQHKKMH